MHNKVMKRKIATFDVTEAFAIEIPRALKGAGMSLDAFTVVVVPHDSEAGVLYQGSNRVHTVHGAFTAWGTVEEIIEILNLNL